MTRGRRRVKGQKERISEKEVRDRMKMGRKRREKDRGRGKEEKRNEEKKGKMGKYSEEVRILLGARKKGTIASGRKCTHGAREV
jgi:hypothetical protein